jgi:hypothetical protein
MTAFMPHPHRGLELLLVHCAPVADDRQPAYDRLQQEVGGDLARLLVVALVGPQSRRGSSSP